MNTEGRGGAWLLVVALVAFAALVLPNVLGDGDLMALPAERPATPQPAPAPSDDPEPPEDATGEAFAAVRAGDCLAVYDTGTGEWSSDLPARVRCDAAEAHVRVTDVLAQTADCPEGAGRSFWSYTWGVQTVALCLERQFEPGDCMLGRTADDGDDGVVQAGLLTVVDCDAPHLPEGYDRVLRVTGVQDAAEVTDGPRCARAATDTGEYWYWLVNGGRTLVCTVEHRSAGRE
ncbi:hypothetical protein [Streptomyces sp. RFCAC02]|uniref:LppU/SCO3897 family protein n=1 Tax=Streptomyces sp. RFCAC02 TaxID=2499143 RepID=UPI001022558E|nr:hypothetical protein [Streptomyces sp. RFCAC02]